MNDYDWHYQKMQGKVKSLEEQIDRQEIHIQFQEKQKEELRESRKAKTQENLNSL